MNIFGNSFYLLGTYLVLRKYATEHQPLSIAMIKRKLADEFQLENTIDTRTIKSHLQRIKELNMYFEVIEELVEIHAIDGTSQYYLMSPIDSTQIRMLSDVIAASKYLNRQESKDLIEVLYQMNGLKVPSFYNDTIKNKKNLASYNKEVFLSVEQIAQAIQNKQQIQCIYHRFNKDSELEPIDAQPRIINVHEIVWTSNYYYALCVFADTGKIYFLRIDKMKHVKCLDQKRTDNVNGIDISAYITTQPYLFGGLQCLISFNIHKRLLDTVIDSFGNAAKRTFVNEETYRIEIISSIEMMHVWLLQYCRYVSNIYPEVLKEKVVASLKQSLQQLES